MKHDWEETDISQWKKQKYWQFYECRRCGIRSSAIERGKDPNEDWRFCNDDCDMHIIGQVQGA